MGRRTVSSCCIWEAECIDLGDREEKKRIKGAKGICTSDSYRSDQ
jgi:hypothetical protein